MKNVQTEIREYLSPIDLNNFVGLTLTLKQGLDGYMLNNERCTQNLRHFMNVINKKVFGNANKRYGKKLQIFPVIEKSKEGRYHYHMIIERPLEWCLDDFTHLIETEWVKTQFGHRQLHLDQFIDFGWVHYITKFHSKSDLVDWENVHIVR